MGIARRLPKRPAVLLLFLFVVVLLGPDGDSDAVQAKHYNTGCACRREVALTFDDGPNPPYTQQILDILQAHHAKATFFVEGEAAAASPELVERENELGMAIGSHSYSHSDELPLMSPEDFRADLQRAEAVLDGILGCAPKIYRAPHGRTSAVMLRELYHAGYVSIGYDVDSRDWDNVTVDQIVEDILPDVHPGAIIVLHDGGLSGGIQNRTPTLEALPRILDWLEEEGYETVTVPEIIGMDSWCSGLE